jgi:exopolysaccharide production protein ExoY
LSNSSAPCSYASVYLQDNASKRARFRQNVQKIAKRAFDFGGSLTILLCICPLFLAVVLLMGLCHGWPVFYQHKRVGRAGREFGCLKFRTMVKNGDAVLNAHLDKNSDARAEWLESRKLKQDPRVTSIGRVLRKSSIDELPQLINVLRGEMSLVGPRPIVSDEVVYYADAIDYYLSVKPGMTGPWQIAGRNDVSYEKRVQMDRDYVITASFWRDFVILLQTVPAVVASRGSY